MDHRQALDRKAAERYLLGEMSEPERFDFESHYFECQECAGDVRAVHTLARGVKELGREEAAAGSPAPRRQWLAWLTPPVLAPAAMALGFAVLAGYQAWVVIPSMRWQTGSLATAPTALRAAARGEEQALEIRKDDPVSVLSLDVNNAEPGTPLAYEVIAPGGEVRIANSTRVPPPGAQLIVLLSNTEFRQPGAWALVLRTKKGVEVARYPFTVQLK
jgi:hypothetical protein